MALPASPSRPITPHVRRRATIEPRVRGWWLVFLATMLVAAYFCVTQYIAWRAENRLLTEGTPVQATIDSVGRITAPRARFEPNLPANLTFQLNDQEYRVEGILAGRIKPLEVGERVTLHVDPADPATHWTAREKATSFGAAFVAVWTLVALALLALAGGLFGRRRVLRLYETGATATATVEDVRQTALAPSSRLVRCAIDSTGDNRLYSVYYPRTPIPVDVGQQIPVIYSKSGKAIAVDWFGER